MKKKLLYTGITTAALFVGTHRGKQCTGGYRNDG